MRRRAFLKNSLFTAGALTLPGVPAADASKRQIQYIREKIPSFEIPAYRGQAYQDRVPDTLDVAERASLAIHALTSMPDPEADYEIYWSVNFFRNPPTMVHAWDDWIQYQEGFLEALPLLRLATGDDRNSHVDQAWMTVTLKSIGPDGPLYIPIRGRPWATQNALQGLDPVWRADGTTTSSKDSTVTQFTNVSACARMIGAMTIYYLRDRNPVWKASIEKMINRFAALAIHRDDYCYFAPGIFEPNAKVDTGAPMPVGSLWGVSWNTRLIQGLAQYYRATGYEPARTLGRKLTTYTLRHGRIFDDKGRWLLDPEFRQKMPYPDVEVSDATVARYYKQGMNLGGHGPGHLIGLLSLLDYAIAVKDRELLDFSKSSFEWSRKPGDAYGVSTLVGWFPEMYLPAYPAADDPPAQMIAIAIKLSAAGAGDYWDDIDRWVRNHFAEQQLTPAKLEYVHRLAARSPRQPVAWNETADRVAERNMGGFSSGVSGNDWALGATTHGITQCCTGNGARVLYYVWEHMLHYDGERLKVHLLLNRASRWADVYSYIPYTGRIDLKIKEDCRGVLVRAPQWVESRSPQLVCRVNEAARVPGWEGRYVDSGAVKAGDRVTFTFPISERTVTERVGPAIYKFGVKGNTVVSVDPVGKNVPLYQDRGKYRTGTVEWRQARRFVSQETILW